MRRSLSVLVYCALFCGLVVPGWPSDARGGGFLGPSRAEDRTSTTKPPRLAGDGLPAPPQQAAAWKAPATKLSKEFISATALLFQQGLADPRGCEYREIEVDVGGFEPGWGDEVIKTHGWVLPAAGKQSQRFGVCWNGLVYPLAAVGKPADLRADAAAAAKGQVETAIGGTGWTWMAYYEDHCFCHPWEGRTVAQDSPLPVKACLLLRLGEAELAEKVWNRWTSGLNGWQWFVKNDRGFDELRHEDDKPYLKDPYLVLANLWTLALFDRAVVAHVRGDDPLALASLETLATALPAAKAEAARRGFAQPAPQKSDQWAPCFYFLLEADRATQLLADQRQRAQQRSQAIGPPVLAADCPPGEFLPALLQRLAQCPDRAHRIALLIQELEEIPYYYDRSQLIDLLCLEGDDAVEPLLACLESDNRLTRAYLSDKPYPRAVYPLAEEALETILEIPFRQFDSEDGTPRHEEDGIAVRQALARRIRAYWDRYKGLSLPERWYRMLADDQADARDWFVAAGHVVCPASLPLSERGGLWSWQYEALQLTYKEKLHGDILRSKAGPSVAELMAKRAKELNARRASTRCGVQGIRGAATATGRPLRPGVEERTQGTGEAARGIATTRVNVGGLAERRFRYGPLLGEMGPGGRGAGPPRRWIFTAPNRRKTSSGPRLGWSSFMSSAPKSATGTRFANMPNGSAKSRAAGPRGKRSCLGLRVKPKRSWNHSGATPKSRRSPRWPNGFSIAL